MGGRRLSGWEERFGYVDHSSFGAISVVVAIGPSTDRQESPTYLNWLEGSTFKGEAYQALEKGAAAGVP